MGQDDPLRPVLGPRPRGQFPFRDRLDPHSAAAADGRPAAGRPALTHYYPGLRSSQHPNANVPAIGARHCTPSRGAVMAGGMGWGR